MDWRDDTTYGQRAKKKIPSTWSCSDKEITIRVHRHIYYPKDQWLLSSEPFYDKYELKSIDIDKAKKEAINLVGNKLACAAKVFNRDILEENSKKYKKTIEAALNANTVGEAENILYNAL